MVCITPHSDVGTDVRSRAAPQNFVIHKIFMHHLRDVQIAQVGQAFNCPAFLILLSVLKICLLLIIKQ